MHAVLAIGTSLDEIEAEQLVAREEEWSYWESSVFLMYFVLCVRFCFDVCVCVCVFGFFCVCVGNWRSNKLWINAFALIRHHC